MKTTSRLFLLAGLLMSSVYVFGQQIEVTKYVDDCKNESFSDDPTYYNQQVYNSETKTFNYCLNGTLKSNKVKLPEGKEWSITNFGNEVYFETSNAENDIYSYEYVHYDYKGNIVGEPVKLLSLPTDLNRFGKYKQFTSPNNKYRALRVDPVSSPSSFSAYGDVSTSTIITVFNQALEILYTKELKKEFTPKEFSYDQSNFLGNDGSWYWFGTKYSGKGKTKSGQYGCYITNPEGNTSKFIPIDFDLGYIRHVNNVLKDDRLIQFGKWANFGDDGSLNGSFYMELDLKTMEVINKQTTTLSGEELAKFAFSPVEQNKVANTLHISGVYYLDLNTDKPQFENGRYVAIYNRKIYTASTPTNTFEVGSFIIMTFGPKAEDMTNTFVLVNQRSPGREIPFSSGAGFANNTVVLFFNDHEANAGITESGSPKRFEPFPVQQNATTTFAVMFSQNGTLKREQIASYKDDNRVYLLSGEKLSDDSFIIYMREDPPMRLGDDVIRYVPGVPYQVTIK